MGKSNKVLKKQSKSRVLDLTRVNMLLYGLLLIATPFLMLQNFLQTSIKQLSRWHLHIYEFDVPFVLLAASALIAFLLIYYRKHLTFWNLSVFIFVLLLIIIGHSIADYYLDFVFYDLQNNWHYFAYGIFVFIAYRNYRQKKFSLERIIIRTYIAGLLISSFDEGIQVFISNRVFDISDIAKDLWGLMMGLLILSFCVKKDEMAAFHWKFRNRQLTEYHKNPNSLLLLLLVLSFILLSVSSLMTDSGYWFMILCITVALFLIIFLLFHISQFRKAKLIILVCTGVAIVVQCYFLFIHYDEPIIYKQPHLIVYKGFPIVYFDVMFFPDGKFRFVDKKTIFKGGDLTRMLRQKADILLIGSGSSGEGGKGIYGTPYIENVQFLYNKFSHKGMQVAILPTPEACKQYNSLIKKGYNILFVVHNS